MQYIIISMALFILVAYFIYYRSTITKKIAITNQLVRLGIYARLYNYFEEFHPKADAALLAEVIVDEVFFEPEEARREKSVLFHVINRDEVAKNIYQINNDAKLKTMLNIGLYAEALDKIKKGIHKNEAYKKLNNLEKFALRIPNIENRYPLKMVLYLKANRFYKLTKSDSIKAKLKKETPSS